MWIIPQCQNLQKLSQITEDTVHPSNPVVQVVGLGNAVDQVPGPQKLYEVFWGPVLLVPDRLLFCVFHVDCRGI